MKVLAGSLKEGTKLKAAQANLTNFSKLAKENTNYRLFFPLLGGSFAENDLIVTSSLGRQADRDAINASFVAYKDSEYEQNEQTGKIIDKTVLKRLAAVARAFHKAACEAEKKDREEEAEKKARELGQEKDQISLALALKAIDVEYFGDDTVNPKIPPSKKPFLSGLKTPLVTEVFAVPVTTEGIPVFEQAFHAAMEINNKKSVQLGGILANRDYVEDGDLFLEVGYNYAGKDKKEAGKNAAFQGIAHDLRLCNHNKSKELWEANKARLDVVSRDPEVMLSKSPMFAYASSVDTIIANVNKYIATKALTLIHLDMDSDDVKKNADIFLTLDAVKSSKILKQKFEAIQEANEAEDAKDGLEKKGEETLDGEVSNEAATVAKAKTLSDIKDVSDLDSATGAEPLSDLDEL